ncbi:MAG: MFS transporter [Ancrocorticia sp.]|uniref:MFS transporter n=1 Tax=Ancrocorticia sp. TaxID=2593684 RepID=UPI003F8DAB08
MAEYIGDRRIVFCVAYFGYTVCYLVRNNFRLVSSQLGADMELSAVEVGVVLSFFPIAYGFGKLAMGILVDRTSMPLMLGVALLGSSVICFLIPFATGPLALKILLSLLGIVQGAGAPACLAMLNAWYPNASRGAAVSAWNTSQNLGAAALAAFAAWILSQFGDWRLVFWIPAAVSAILLLPLYRYGKDRPWREGFPTLTQMYGKAGVPALHTPAGDSYWQLIWMAFRSSPALMILVGLNALLYFIRFGVINWMVSYLPEEKGLLLSDSQSLFGILEFAAIPFVIIFAVIAWKMPARMSSVGVGSMAVLAIALVGYAGFAGGLPLGASVAVIGGLIYAPQVIVNILTLNLTPPRMVGAAVGIVGLSGYLIGEVGANLILPRLAEGASWDAVYVLLSAVALCCALLYRVLKPYERRAVVVD